LKKLIENMYKNFILDIPEEFKEDIFSELLDKNFEDYYRCTKCGKVKHISKFTQSSMTHKYHTKTKECLSI